MFAITGCKRVLQMVVVKYHTLDYVTLLPNPTFATLLAKFQRRLSMEYL